MKFTTSLKRALLLNFILAAVLPLILFALLTLNYVRNYLLEEVARDNRFLASEIRADAQQFLQRPVAALRQISKIFYKQGVLAGNGINDYLEREVRGSDLFESIYLLDPSGKVLYLGVSNRLEQQKPDYLAIDLSSHEIFSRQLEPDEVYWSDTFISVVTGEPSITLGMEVRDQVLIGNVSLQNLNRIVSRFSEVGEEMTFAIVDRKGILIAHSEPDLALQRVSMMFHPEVARAVETGIVEDIHIHEDGSLLESVLRIPETDWVVWVGRDRGAVLAPINDVQLFMTWVLAASIVIGTILSVYNSRKLMRPIAELVANTGKLADGQYEIEPAEKVYEEIDALSAGFEQMVEAVRERETSIADRESRFRNLVNSIEGIVWEFDLRENRFVFVSRQCEAMLGCTYRQWLESPDFWKTHVHPDDRQWVSDYFVGLSEGNLSPQLEFRMLNSAGKLLWVRVMVNVVRNDGKAARLYGVIIDITERKSSEIALRNSEVRFRSLVEQAADAIFIYDRSGRFVEVNDQACVSLGYSRDELLKKSVEEVDMTHDPAQTLSILNSVRHGATLTLEGEYRRKDGSCFPVEVRIGSFTFEERPLYLALARDISERKKSEEALRTSEERFRNYFELGLIGMALTRPDGTFIQFNDRLCEIVGYDRAELEQKTWRDITHPEDLADDQKEIEKLLCGEIKRFSKEKRYVRKSGDVAYATISVTGVMDENGKIDHLIALVEDVTQRKQAEQARRESEEQVRLLLNSTAEGIYGTDLDGNCTFCNPAGLRLLGFRQESELLGRNMHELIHHSTVDGEAFPEQECQIHQAVANSETAHSDEEVFWRKDGSWFHVEYFGHPVFKEQQLIGAVVTFHDITERKALQQQSIRTAQLASLGELAAGVAHEINNPINGVINYAQILLNRLQKNGLESDLAERIMKEGERIAVIVRDLLFFAREAGPEVNLANVGEVLSEALSLTEAQIRKEGILLKVDIEDDLPLISTRAQQIQQLFLNILSNARHALNEKYPEHDPGKIIEISINSVRMKKKLYVQAVFKDYGPGIPPQMLEKVMNPFVTTKPAGVGTGLGLSISHEIVENHNGDLNIKSLEGEWTEVTVRLPVVEKEGE